MILQGRASKNTAIQYPIRRPNVGDGDFNTLCSRALVRSSKFAALELIINIAPRARNFSSLGARARAHNKRLQLKFCALLKK